MNEVTFVYDAIIVSTTIDLDQGSQERIVALAAEVLEAHGLDPSRAFEIQVDGQSYDGPLPGE